MPALLSPAVDLAAVAVSPLAAAASHTFTVAAAAAGPFDSHVGLLSLANARLAPLPLRATAADRLAAVEEAWARLDPFTS